MEQTLFSSTARKVSPEAGDLVTVLLFGDKECGARLIRATTDTAFVKLVGLNVPAPYKVGDEFPLAWRSVIDWD